MVVMQWQWCMMLTDICGAINSICGEGGDDGNCVMALRQWGGSSGVGYGGVVVVVLVSVDGCEAHGIGLACAVLMV